MCVKLLHPYVIDTSVVFNLSRKRNMKQKLKVIVSELLGRQIQTSDRGHSSLENARAVTQLVRTKLARDLYWGVEDPLLSVLASDACESASASAPASPAFPSPSASPADTEHTGDQSALEAVAGGDASSGPNVKHFESGDACCSKLSRQHAFFAPHLSSARNVSLFQVIRAASKPPRRM